MSNNESILFLNQKINSLKTLLEECRKAALNREIKTEKCFDSKRSLIAEIKKLKAEIDDLNKK